MQIVEANDLWVRVAELSLSRPSTPLRFVLYPMLHIGSPEFYAEVQRRLGRADVVVLEGVGDSAAARGLTQGYRRLAQAEALGLGPQRIDVAALPGEVVRPDLSGPEFEDRWRTVPWWQRSLAQGASRALLTALHDRRSAEPITVAVVYGAMHMRAVSAGLPRRDGYHVEAGEWLTVTVFE